MIRSPPHLNCASRHSYRNARKYRHASQRQPRCLHGSRPRYGHRRPQARDHHGGASETPIPTSRKRHRRWQRELPSPDASAADRGSSGGDLGPARFRVSSQIAPRMILAHRRVARIPWMPPRPPPPSRPRSRSTFCYPRQSEKNSARLTVVPPPPAPQVFKKCRDHKLCDSKALIGAYTAVPKPTMSFLSNPPTPCPPNRAEPRHLPPVAELTQRRESSVIATRSDPNAPFP